MKSTKTMLLGAIIALLGLGLGQPGNDAFLFRTFLFLPPETVTVFFPIASLIVILAGVVVGIVGFFQKIDV
jgi:hypothetical protein